MKLRVLLLFFNVFLVLTVVLHAKEIPVIDGLDLSQLLADTLESGSLQRQAYITFYNYKVTVSDEKLAQFDAQSRLIPAEEYFSEFPTRNQDALDQLRVLAFSLHQSGTKFPLLVLTLVHPTKFPNYYQAYLNPMREKWNVKFLFIEDGHDLGQLWKSKYPNSALENGDLIEGAFSRGDLLSHQQSRYYNKFYAWALAPTFTKLIYLEMNNLVRKNLDSLFDNPQFSGVPLVGNSFNTAVLVIEPNSEIFQELKAKYVDKQEKYLGDQAFLNHYFFNVTNHLTRAPHELPSIYNLSTRNKAITRSLL